MMWRLGVSVVSLEDQKLDQKHFQQIHHLPPTIKLRASFYHHKKINPR